MCTQVKLINGCLYFFRPQPSPQSSVTSGISVGSSSVSNSATASPPPASAALTTATHPLSKTSDMSISSSSPSSPTDSNDKQLKQASFFNPCNSKRAHHFFRNNSGDLFNSSYVPSDSTFDDSQENSEEVVEPLYTNYSAQNISSQNYSKNIYSNTIQSNGQHSTNILIRYDDNDKNFSENDAPKPFPRHSVISSSSNKDPCIHNVQSSVPAYSNVQFSNSLSPMLPQTNANVFKSDCQNNMSAAVSSYSNVTSSIIANVSSSTLPRFSSKLSDDFCGYKTPCLIPTEGPNVDNVSYIKPQNIYSTGPAIAKLSEKFSEQVDPDCHSNTLSGMSVGQVFQNQDFNYHSKMSDEQSTQNMNFGIQFRIHDEQVDQKRSFYARSQMTEGSRNENRGTNEQSRISDLAADSNVCFNTHSQIAELPVNYHRRFNTQSQSSDGLVDSNRHVNTLSRMSDRPIDSYRHMNTQSRMSDGPVDSNRRFNTLSRMYDGPVDSNRRFNTLSRMSDDVTDVSRNDLINDADCGRGGKQIYGRKWSSSLGRRTGDLQVHRAMQVSS